MTVGARRVGLLARGGMRAVSGASAVGVATMAGGRRRRTGEHLARRLDRLGGVYLKAGQVLSTRVDLLPDHARAALGRLCDDTTPAAVGDAEAFVRSALGSGNRARLVDLDPAPIGAGSVTQVYRARRADTGTAVAVKALRPDARGQFTADLAVTRAAASMAARAPVLRAMPVTGATTLLTDAMAAHLDLRAEADHHVRIARQLAEEGVVVPRIHSDLCTPSALVMDLVDAARIDHPRLDPELARAGVRTALRCLYSMIFRHGLVHCDLHPGNVLVTPAGALVLIDFGYVAKLTPSQQHAFARLFASMALDDAEGVAAVVVDSARSVPAAVDRDALTADVEAHLARAAATTPGEFAITRFVAGLFAIQRRHRIVASPDLAMGIVALTTLEGLLKRFSPDLDYQREALPYVLERLDR